MESDKQLQSAVEQELRYDPSVRSEQIGVSVKRGVVELNGQVDSYYEKWSAERAAMRVANTKALASEIKVELPNSEIRSDEDMARTAMTHLDWNFSVPNTVKVQVSGGWVTLLGTTQWQFQKEEAENAVRHLKGVKWVTNAITVNPKLNASGVKLQIENALKRNAETGAGHVAVETVDG